MLAPAAGAIAIPTAPPLESSISPHARIRTPGAMDLFVGQQAPQCQAEDQRMQRGINPITAASVVVASVEGIVMPKPTTVTPLPTVHGLAPENSWRMAGVVAHVVPGVVEGVVAHVVPGVVAGVADVVAHVVPGVAGVADVVPGVVAGVADVVASVVP